MGSASAHQLTRKGKSTGILYVGVDLAKNVVAVHGVNEVGKPELVCCLTQSPPGLTACRWCSG